MADVATSRIWPKEGLLKKKELEKLRETPLNAEIVKEKHVF